MKLMRYSGRHETSMLARLGVLVDNDLVADVRAGYAMYLVEKARNPKGRQIADIYFPSYIAQFLHIGEAAWLALADAHSYLTRLAEHSPDATGPGDEELFIPLRDCRLYAPLRPSKLIAIAGNYPQDGKPEMKPAGKIPGTFVKTLSAITGPEREIVRPTACQRLDCETELGIVIGKKCKHVSEDEAYSVVAGYTIVNDVTARDIGEMEQEGGHLFLGKTFDTFAPTGPWMVTRGGIPDPMNLQISTRVNGEQRQHGNTRDMHWSIPKIIAHLSQLTLMPGDIISTGSPGGGLANPAWSLKPGDVVEAVIDGIGVLRNRVVDEPKDSSLNFSD